MAEHAKMARGLFLGLILSVPLWWGAYYAVRTVVAPKPSPVTAEVTSVNFATD